MGCLCVDVTVCCVAGFVWVSLSLYVSLCCVLVCMTQDEGGGVFADILMCMCTLLNVLILIICYYSEHNNKNWEILFPLFQVSWIILYSSLHVDYS